MFTTTYKTARFVTAPARQTGLVHWLHALIAAQKSRIALANLDAAGRADVALSETQINSELARPIWDVPTAWKR
ncbi:MAG: hypothetical protein HKP37_08435 [Boseongicola sp.]|nr:hypothetical protein [Boseongicola sp.]